jgi:hypothetical protein
MKHHVLLLAEQFNEIVLIQMDQQESLDTEICDAFPLAAIYWAVLAPSAAANTSPPPEPGYRAAGAHLFYVTAYGRCWLVRDARGRVQLTPAALPPEFRAIDEIASIDIGIVEEAADLIEQRQPAGIYHASQLFYFLTDAGAVWMLYGPEHTAVSVPCLPPHASRVDLPPPKITSAIARMKWAG